MEVLTNPHARKTLTENETTADSTLEAYRSNVDRLEKQVDGYKQQNIRLNHKITDLELKIR